MEATKIEPNVAWMIGFAMLIMMKIVCFILGYLTVRLGHDLIKRGVTGEFRFSTEFAGVKADLASISPGLLFVLLGVALAGFAMWVPKSVELTVTPIEQTTPPVVPVPGIPTP